MDQLKLLTEDNLEPVRKLFAAWWHNEHIELEAQLTLVVTIYGKGDPSLQGNYRPFSLLETLYKFYAGIITRRLILHIDDCLHPQQYGFRKKRSTSQPIDILS